MSPGSGKNAKKRRPEPRRSSTMVGSPVIPSRAMYAARMPIAVGVDAVSSFDDGRMKPGCSANVGCASAMAIACAVRSASSPRSFSRRQMRPRR